MLRKTLCCLLCCIAILCLTATSAFASGSGDWRTQPLSLSFDFSGLDPAPRGTVDVRQVAVVDELGGLQWTADYADAGISLAELDGEKTAARLLFYAETKAKPAQKVEIGKDGKATLEITSPGVYLVSQIDPFPGYTCMQPALVSVPMNVEGEWICGVSAMPKLEPLIEETTTPTTSPSKPPPELPQTGQLNWPVPILLLAGSVLILLGICLRKDKRHET